MVKPSPSLGNGSCVTQRADRTLNLGQVSTRNGCWGLVVDTHLEPSRAPVNKLNSPLGLDGSNGGIDIFGDNVSAVQEAASHVLAVAGIALYHLICGLEASIGDLSDRQLLVVGLLGDDGGIGGQGEMDTRIGDQIGLELGQ